MLRHLAPVFPRLAPASVRGFAVAGNHMALIKELREASGAPIADVKTALQQANWDLDQAAQELRKKGIASAGKKASRVAAEGLVGLAADADGIAVVEINSETDFVPRNDVFKKLVASAAAGALKIDVSPSSTTQAQSIDAANVLQTSSSEAGRSIKDLLENVAGTVRENIQLRRAFYLPIPSGGVVGTYIHQSAGDSLGKIAAAVTLAPQEEGAALTGEAAVSAAELARKLGMQVVASTPRFLSRDDVTPEAVKEEEDILREQALKSGKPAKIVDRMIAGRMSKFYQEVCLVEQPFVMDDSKKVNQVVQELGAEVGTPLKLVSYLRVKVGEGVDKDEKDFAAEVAATLKDTA